MNVNEATRFLLNVEDTLKNNDLIREDGKGITFIDRLLCYFGYGSIPEHFKIVCEKIAEISSQMTPLTTSQNFHLLFSLKRIQIKLKNIELNQNCARSIDKIETAFLNSLKKNHSFVSLIQDLSEKIIENSAKNNTLKFQEELSIFLSIIHKFKDNEYSTAKISTAFLDFMQVKVIKENAKFPSFLDAIEKISKALLENTETQLRDIKKPSFKIYHSLLKHYLQTTVDTESVELRRKAFVDFIHLRKKDDTFMNYSLIDLNLLHESHIKNIIYSYSKLHPLQPGSYLRQIADGKFNDYLRVYTTTLKVIEEHPEILCKPLQGKKSRLGDLQAELSDQFAEMLSIFAPKLSTYDQMDPKIKMKFNDAFGQVLSSLSELYKLSVLDNQKGYGCTSIDTDSLSEEFLNSVTKEGIGVIENLIAQRNDDSAFIEHILKLLFWHKKTASSLKNQELTKIVLNAYKNNGFHHFLNSFITFVVKAIKEKNLENYKEFIEFHELFINQFKNDVDALRELANGYAEAFINCFCFPKNGYSEKLKADLLQKYGPLFPVIDSIIPHIVDQKVKINFKILFANFPCPKSRSDFPNLLLTEQEQMTSLAEGIQAHEDTEIQELIKSLERSKPSSIQDISRLAKMITGYGGLSKYNLTKLRKKIHDLDQSEVWFSDDYLAVKEKLEKKYLLSLGNTPLTNAIKKVSKCKKFFLNQSLDRILIPRWYHVTSDKGLTAIIKSGKQEVRHEKTFSGAWISSRIEGKGYGSHALGYLQNIGNLTADIHYTHDEKRWRGSRTHIDLKDQLAFVAIQDELPKETKKIFKLQIGQWLGEKRATVPVISMETAAEIQDMVSTHLGAPNLSNAWW